MTMARFLPIGRDGVYLLPPSVQDWLPETHLARYIAYDRRAPHGYPQG